ncbi:response regulator [Actinomadura oligospora]|uniref:response regulator n=1 Tax=Actinomadura oligospora TaxID=111804 RepID=UPI00047CDC15|nr:response regulator transcription factor [Actinomadura oligospora]
MTVRVVVADDQTLVRAGFAGIIRAADGFTVVAEAADGREAVEAARLHRPDVVLMDIRMPVMDGIAATREVTSTTTAKVLVLTTFDVDAYVYEALRAGAGGFVLKDVSPADLLAGIRAVVRGDALLAPTVTRRLIDAFTARPPVPSPDRLGITGRELDVLTLIAAGHTNSEIAARLHITEGTTKTHVSRLLAKLQARDRVHLVLIAHRHGIAPPP